MKTLYLECAMGAAGDMLMGALYELYPEKKQFLRTMNHLFPGLTVEAESVRRQGIAGTHMRVVVNGAEEGPGGLVHAVGEGHDHEHDHHHEHGHHHHHQGDGGGHHHHTPGHIRRLIQELPLPQPVRDQAAAVYGLLAQAEARAHGVPVEEVHFHEVGAMDAVADVVGVCLLLHLLSPDRIAASPVTVGSGTVSTAHGLLPVPAPATACLLEGVPVTAGDIAAELCTPTGAALLRTFASSFGPMPAGVLLRCGHGCGAKDFPRANCVRAFLLEEDGGASKPRGGEGPNDAVTELKANIDDMTGEALGFAMETLLAAGALDVSYQPIQMKKNRPGVLLTCLCRPAEADRLAREILRHTTTFGVRRTDCARYALTPASVTEHSSYGPVRRKEGMGYGVTKAKVEYADMARIAREQNIPLSQVPDILDRE